MACRHSEVGSLPLALPQVLQATSAQLLRVPIRSPHASPRPEAWRALTQRVLGHGNHIDWDVYDDRFAGRASGRGGGGGDGHNGETIGFNLALRSCAADSSS